VPRFVTRRDVLPAVETPEALFRELRPRDGNVRHLWAHQADLLRSYQRLQGADVAVELPTGAGKTLVGLLLGEYRRRANNERVAYLCPTVQLARQAAARAADYGIDAVALVRRQADYDAADFTAYQRAQKVAITTYNGVFNTNPRIDAQALVLDDAHAAEGPVASLWAVEARRGTPLYDALLPAVIGGLTRAFADDLRDQGLDPVRRYDVELVPLTYAAEQAELVRDAIAAHASDHNRFAGRMISQQIGHCLIYVSWPEILIRPFIPPTSDHAPFADANQRIYMSATLGQGGELERAFGVERIERLPVPAGWDEHGSGRRFFLFPNASLEPADVDTFVAGAIERAEKALVIAPSNAELDRFVETAAPSGMPEIRTGDAEQDYDAFSNADGGVMLVANRYDGIDLPDDVCRLIVLSGLPAATHLQERFIYDRLRARRVLAERIRTRLTQGAGRCTRNPQDFAAVIMRGEHLVDFCARDENREALHPELQAEFAFGLDNSEAEGDLLGLLDSFLDQDNDWRGADADIRARVQDATRATPPDSAVLAASAASEVRAWRDLWRGDLDMAIDAACAAAARLTSEELRSYRALWLYFAASWAAERATDTQDEVDARFAREMKRDLERCARTLSFVPRVAVADPAPAPGAEYALRADRAAQALLRLQPRGRIFEPRMAEFLERVQDDAATPFELGLQTLGELLGFESVRPNEQADPDGIWRDEERQWFLFEAKTEVQAGRAIDAHQVRQASSHKTWTLNRYGWPQPEAALTVIVTKQTEIDDNARNVAGDVYVVHPDVLRTIAERVVAVHREIRTKAPGLSEEQLRDAFAAAFVDRGLDTASLVGLLSTRTVTGG
jgi:DEAD/DEAH box helicase/Helicase C-terminal domain